MLINTNRVALCRRRHLWKCRYRVYWNLSYPLSILNVIFLKTSTSTLYYAPLIVKTMHRREHAIYPLVRWNRSPFWNALSHEFRCRWRHLSCKLRPEIDNRFTFTLIKTTMRFKQIRKNIYRFWCHFTKYYNFDLIIKVKYFQKKTVRSG
jgi:hypothetical protein